MQCPQSIQTLPSPNPFFHPFIYRHIKVKALSLLPTTAHHTLAAALSHSTSTAPRRTLIPTWLRTNTKHSIYSHIRRMSLSVQNEKGDCCRARQSSAAGAAAASIPGRLGASLPHARRNSTRLRIPISPVTDRYRKHSSTVIAVCAKCESINGTIARGPTAEKMPIRLYIIYAHTRT